MAAAPSCCPCSRRAPARDPGSGARPRRPVRSGMRASPAVPGRALGCSAAHEGPHLACSCSPPLAAMSQGSLSPSRQCAGRTQRLPPTASWHDVGGVPLRDGIKLARLRQLLLALLGGGEDCLVRCDTTRVGRAGAEASSEKPGRKGSACAESPPPGAFPCRAGPHPLRAPPALAAAARGGGGLAEPGGAGGRVRAPAGGAAGRGGAAMGTRRHGGRAHRTARHGDRHRRRAFMAGRQRWVCDGGPCEGPSRYCGRGCQGCARHGPRSPLSAAKLPALLHASRAGVAAAGLRVVVPAERPAWQPAPGPASTGSLPSARAAPASPSPLATPLLSPADAGAAGADWSASSGLGAACCAHVAVRAAPPSYAYTLQAA
jgi:hypothetical protein